MTEANMPPPERPKRTRRYGEQEHLREDAGMEQGPEQGVEPAEHLREDAGSSDLAEQEEADKGLVEKAKDKLTGR